MWKALGNRSGVATTLYELALNVLCDLGQYEEARAALDESLALFREVIDKWRVVGVLLNRGWLEFNIGETTWAIDDLEECLGMFRDSGVKTSIGWTLAFLGKIARYQEDYPKSLAYFREALGIFRETGQEVALQFVLVGEGFLAFRQGNGARALELFKESLAFKRNPGRLPTLHRAMALIGLAGLSAVDGHPERAARLLGAAEGMIESAWTQFPIHHTRADYVEYERILSLARAQLDEEPFSWLSQEGRALAAEGLDQVLAYALQDIS